MGVKSNISETEYHKNIKPMLLVMTCKKTGKTLEKDTLKIVIIRLISLSTSHN